MKSRRGFAIQRLMNAMRQAHADGWFIVFDTLTLADDRLEAFYDNPNALRDYVRDMGRRVLAAEGRKAKDSHADCYQYFCVLFFQAEDGIRHVAVTGVQTCALPISAAGAAAGCGGIIRYARQACSRSPPGTRRNARPSWRCLAQSS